LIRNYFSDLELQISASEEDIRRAYKRLARKLHPDLNPNDPQAAAAFRRIQEAYQALNSTTRIFRIRRQLQNGGESVRRTKTHRWPDAPTIPSSPREFLKKWTEEKTKTGKTKTKTSTRTSSRTSAGTSVSSKIKKNQRPTERLDIELKVMIDDRLLRVGGRQKIEFPFQKPCPLCRGIGASARSIQVICKNCAGLGYHYISRGAYQFKKACDPCEGRGYKVVKPCEGCQGRGKVADSQVLNLKLTAPLKPDQMFRLKNLGHISFDGKKRGDVWVSLTPKN